MVNILDILVNILCRPENAYNCQRFIQSYPNIFEQLIYFLFFPMVFIILFVYFLSDAVSENHKGLRILVGVGVFIFIILQGWYHIFLYVSKFWFFSIIILGGLFVFIHKMGVRGGAEERGQTATKTGLLPKAVKKFEKELRREDQRELEACRKETDRLIDLRKKVDRGEIDHAGEAIRAIGESSADIEERLRALMSDPRFREKAKDILDKLRSRT